MPAWGWKGRGGGPGRHGDEAVVRGAWQLARAVQLEPGKRS